MSRMLSVLKAIRLEEHSRPLGWKNRSGLIVLDTRRMISILSVIRLEEDKWTNCSQCNKSVK